VQPVHVFFFRGLSTYGHDHAKWSVFDFGPVYKHFARAFAQRQLFFHPVTGLGSGSLPEITARAKEFLKQHPVWKDPDVKVHFLGHSAGGLAARLTLNELAAPGKVLSCLTIASPHQGSQLARICIDMPERYRGSALLLRSFGYDVRAKKHFFDELTSENVRRLFAATPQPATQTASIVCASPRTDWCKPLKLFYMVKAFNDFDLPSDGVVERDTQPYGEVIAELKLDHFRQVGLFGENHRFEQMCDVAADYFKKMQKS